MVKYLSGRQKRRPQDKLTEDRYQYLGLDQAEPNLADPATSPGVPAGAQFQLIAVSGFDGQRFWVPVGGELQPGSITIFDEGSQVSGTSSITQLNFVGAAVTAVASVQSPSGHPGVAATVTVIPVTVGDNPPIGAGTTNNGELWWESDTGDLYVYYNDGDSSQWVMANSGGRGLTGDKGEVGSKGDKGQKGELGTTGSQGDKGDKGAPSTVAGAKGDKGEVGNDGSDGSKGDKGQKGEDGADSTEAGPKGDKGEVGDKGEAGDKGDKGEVGDKGQKGEVGDKGQKGQKGQKGEIGADSTVAGPKGEKGAEGNFGGATFDYTFSSSTGTPTDLNTGRLRLNNSSVSSATIMFIDDEDDNGTNIEAFLRTVDDSTSTIKGHVRISNKLDASDFALFTISSATEQSGFHQVGVSYVSGSASSFDNGEDIIVTFARTGDLGDKGQKGQKGEGGADGADGDKGDTGAKGQKGELNDKGQKGETGADNSTKGQKGEKGEVGADGGDGDKGQKGEVGGTGSGGSDGDKGQKGEVGADGSDGDKGQKGEIGATGGTGGTGVQGDKAGIRYRFNTSTTVQNPGTGYILYNSSTLSSISRVVISRYPREGNTVDFKDFLTSFDNTNNDSTSIDASLVVKSNVNSDTTYTSFQITRVELSTDQSHVRCHVDTSATSGSIPSSNEELVITLSKAGDKGQKGEKGQIGADGGSGSDGDKGQKGEVGAGGSGGDKGQKGEVGQKGQTGADNSTKGQKGEVGDKGAQGSSVNSSVAISSSAPSSPSAGDLWWDSDDGDLHVYYNDGNTSQWVNTGGVGSKGQKGEVGTGDKGQKGEASTTAGDKGQKGEIGGAPVGQVVAWSGSASSLPTGYLLCDGSAVSRSTYAPLFAVVGTTHGAGDGSSTFNLPDLRDKFVLGASNSTGDTTYPGVSPGATGGSADATLVSHTHNLLYNHGAFGGTSGAVTPRSGNTPVTPGISGRISTEGSSATNANLPPYYALAYIIQHGVGGDVAKGQKGEIGSAGDKGSTGAGDKGQKGDIGAGAPVGQVVAWSGSASSLPAGYLLCDGSAISRSTYAALYDVIGTTHGVGDGSSTFNIPDLKDRFVVGATNSTGDTTWPGLSPGATGGSADNSLPSHYHNFPGDDQLTYANNIAGWSNSHDGNFSYDATSTTSGGGKMWRTSTEGTTGTNENLPPYYSLAYIIQFAQGGDAAKGQKGEASTVPGPIGDIGQKGEIGIGEKGQKGEEGTLKPSSASGGGSLLTTNTSYQNVVSVTITPSQSNSHIMVIATGTVGGEEGNNNNNSGTGTAQITRDTTQLGDAIASSQSKRNTRFDQALIDTNNHGGSAVTYRIRLKKGGGNQAHAYLGAARSTNGSNSQGSARLLLLEILQ